VLQLDMVADQGEVIGVRGMGDAIRTREQRTAARQRTKPLVLHDIVGILVLEDDENNALNSLATPALPTSADYVGPRHGWSAAHTGTASHYTDKQSTAYQNQAERRYHGRHLPTVASRVVDQDAVFLPRRILPLRALQCQDFL